MSQAEAAEALPGQPDCLGRLWTPYRMAYIDRPSDNDDCPFCRAPGLDDEEGLIVFRGQLAYVVLNLYPYSPGHLLVCPYRHLADYAEALVDEVTEIATLTQQALRTIRTVSQPAGFNLGQNLGAVAGAGIAGHLHQHVVPRWAGDTNFMPIVARTRAIPQLLAETRALLAQAWPGEVDDDNR